MVPHRAARAEYLNNFIDQAERGGESSITRLREQERLAPGDGAPGVRGLQGDGPPGDHIIPSHICICNHTDIYKDIDSDSIHTYMSYNVCDVFWKHVPFL